MGGAVAGKGLERGNTTMASGSRKLPLLYVLASVTVVLAGLYWARVVLLPVALAVLLTFLLNPVITMLHRWGVPRGPRRGSGRRAGLCRAGRRRRRSYPQWLAQGNLRQIR